MTIRSRLFVAAAALAQLAGAQSACRDSLSPKSGIKPSIASGYQYAVVATGLTSPRGIQFDSQGNLLVVQKGVGVSSHKLQDNGGSCVSVGSSKMVVRDTSVSQHSSWLASRISIQIGYSSTTALHFREMAILSSSRPPNLPCPMPTTQTLLQSPVTPRPLSTR